jgi:hypothetical protein
MTTDIAFLRELHDDLMEAAALSAAPAPVRTRPVATRDGRRWPLPHISLGRRPLVTGFALALAAFVLIATGLGYLSQRSNGPSTRAGGVPLAARQQNPLAALGGAPRHGPGPQSGGTIFGPQSRSEVPSAADAGGGSTSSIDASSGGTSITQQLLKNAGAPSSRSLEIGPLIVKTAELSVQVKRGTFDRAYEQASVVADHYGGFIEASSTSGSTTRTGMLRIRVPAGQFDTAVAALRAVGRVESQSVSGKDVTASYVDLQSRLKTWEAQESSLLALIAKATTIQETLNVQRVLQDVQLQVEQLKGQIRLVDNQTAKGTISVYLHEQPPPKKPVVAKTVITPSLGTGFHKGIKAFFGMLVAFMVGVGYLIPMVALLMVAMAGWLVVRRVRRVA